MPGFPTFSVCNLGPISEGTIELRPLTILIGKNNTGKTYMAQAIYAACKALERSNGLPEPFISELEAEELDHQLNSKRRTDEEHLSGTLQSKAEVWMRDRLDRVGEELADRLSVYFDVDNVGDLKRWGRDGPLAITAEIVQDGFDPVVLFALNAAKKSKVHLPEVSVASLSRSRLDFAFGDALAGTYTDEDVRRKTLLRRESSRLAGHIWRHHLLPAVHLTGIAHYLPAGRSGLLEAWTDVVRLRLEQDREGLGLTGREPAALGGIALDFLLELQELVRPSRKRRRSLSFDWRRLTRSSIEDSVSPKDVELASAYLHDLINGRVAVARGRERVPALTYTQHGESIPVQRASSMVAELAPLISWIEQLLVPGDLLIIDEPEAHMHPEAILAVAQTLVALSQAGVRVLCTTHSSEFLHQVSNCMLRTKAVSGDANLAQASIDTGEIGVYRFVRANDSLGTVIEQVNIDPDWGIPEDEFVAVAEHLANETTSLVDSLRA